MNGIVSEKHLQLATLEKTLGNVSPGRKIELYESYLNSCSERLLSVTKSVIQKYENAMISLGSKLEATSPLKTLQRGYSILLDNNSKAVKSVDNIKAGEDITVIMNGGKLGCTVNSIEVKIEE